MAAYVVVDHQYISNPSAEGLYERVGSSYVETADTTAVPSKAYYMYDDYDETDDDEEYIELELSVGDPVVGYYEFDGEDYFLTSDTVAVSGKEYYEYFDGKSYSEPFDYNTLYYIVSDLVDNPSAEGFYEKNEDGIYVMTEDVVFDSSKLYYLPIEPVVKEEITVTESSPLYNPADTVESGVSSVATAYSDVAAKDFLYAYTNFVEDPSAAGFYEIEDGYYVLTQDTELVRGKAYYERRIYSDYYEANMSGVTNPMLALIRYYEVVQGQYVLTSDTTVVSGKTYYRSRTDDKTPYLNDPSTGQTPATYDDIPIES